MYGRANGYEDYRQNNILTAPPERLLIMLIEGLTLNVRKAHVAIEEDDAQTRRVCLRKARDIVMELINSLDLEVGGEIALNLHRLYTYVNTKLVQADTKNSTVPLVNAQRIIDVLDETWRQAVKNVQRDKAAAASVG